MEKRRSSANCSSTDHRVSACPTCKQGMKAPGFGLEDEDALDNDYEDICEVWSQKHGTTASFARIGVVLSQIFYKFWMPWWGLSIQDMKRSCQWLRQSRHVWWAERKLWKRNGKNWSWKWCKPNWKNRAEQILRARLSFFKLTIKQEIPWTEFNRSWRPNKMNKSSSSNWRRRELRINSTRLAPSRFSMKLNVISGQIFGMVAWHQVIRILSEPS